jgi:hypothetical protein
MPPEYNFVSSTLKITASEHLDVSKDLESTSTKSIAQLLDEEKEEDTKEK